MTDLELSHQFRKILNMHKKDQYGSIAEKKIYLKTKYYHSGNRFWFMSLRRRHYFLSNKTFGLMHFQHVLSTYLLHRGDIITIYKYCNNYFYLLIV